MVFDHNQYSSENSPTDYSFTKIRHGVEDAIDILGEIAPILSTSVQKTTPGHESGDPIPNNCYHMDGIYQLPSHFVLYDLCEIKTFLGTPTPTECYHVGYCDSL